MVNNIFSHLSDIAIRYPNKTAATDENAEITYQELIDLSLRITTSLNSVSFSEKKLAIYLPNGVDALVCIVGSLFAGNCFSVLDVKQPAERNKTICAIGKFEYIITSSAYLSEATLFFDKNKILLFEEAIKTTPANIDLIADVEPDAPAIMFFTSGSTGIPKAVVHTHNRIKLGLTDAIEFFKITPSDRFDMIVPLGFTASMYVYFALLSGSSLHFIDVRKKGIIAYVNFLIKKEINFSTMTVTAFRGVAKLSTILGKLKHFRALHLVGEPVQNSDVQLFRKYCPKEAVLINVYGTTETRFVSFNRFSFNDQLPEKISAGTPFGKTNIFILDEMLELLPPNTTGQIAIHSPYMASGYFNNDTETRNSFIHHKTLDIPIYLTGDLGYLSDDGHLFHQGRNDFMVKIRGNRVDLFEIENSFLQHPSVSDVAVVNKGNTFSDSLIVAYYELKADATVSELREYLSERLADYMIPAYFIKKEALPKTSSGKINRKELIEENLDLSSLLEKDEENTFDFDPLYLNLKKIWMEELKLPRLAPTHCFFNDLGGDSILAVSVIERIRNELDIHLPYFILFRYRTLGKLTEYIHRNGNKIVSLDKLRAPENNNSPVIIFVPPIKGGAHTYNFALKAFPENYGLYVITYNIIDDENRRFYSLETLLNAAKDIVNGMDYPNLNIFGYSMGGLLAYEIAQRAKEGAIKKVILIDIPPAKHKKINLFLFMINDIRLSWRAVLKKEVEPVKVNLNHIGLCFFYLLNNKSTIKKFEAKNHIMLSEAAHLRFYSQFDHGKYKGNMLLIRSSDNKFSDRLFRWEKFIQGKIEIQKIDSDHFTLLNYNNIGKISEIVTAAIQQNRPE
jgi:acyl-coenzyme A synthetase/AMP-(fatty) acid ligase/thioesterase domain-containing protein/acyl carrier protein